MTSSAQKGTGIRKTFFILSGSVLFVALSTAIELAVLGRGRESVNPGDAFLYAMLNLNILAFGFLVYFLSTSIYGLVLEKRSRAIGYRFKRRVVIYFMILTSIPAILLFIIAGGLGKNYIDRYFSPKFLGPLEGSVELVRSVYDLERERAMMLAGLVKSGYRLPPEYRASVVNQLTEESSAAIKSAFEGAPSTEVITTDAGDIIRAAIPLDGAGQEGAKSVIVLETMLPGPISKSSERISREYEEFKSLESLKTPIKLNYLMIFGFFTLIILFASLWVSLRIAGWMTVPVRDLAIATERIAQGDLNTLVKSESYDEMGMLVSSFNNMVREIREGRQSLQQAYANLDNIVRNIRSGIISLDERGNVVSINEAACGILDITPDDVMGKYYSSILSNINSDELARFIESINIKTFREAEREVRVNISGRTSVIKVSIIGIKSAKGGHMGMLVVVDDLTELIKAQRVVAWQEIARRMAHEIKNPLTPIRLSTERMLKKWQTKEADFEAVFERSARSIIREVDSLKRLVDEFSRFGKLPEVSLKPSDLRAVIRDAAALYEDDKNIDIRIDVSSEVPQIDLDVEQFKRVLINLFENSIQAMKGYGTIDVRALLNKTASRVIIEVGDTGAGIPPEIKDKLFQPYVSTKKDGTGLGLAIADRIIAEHGGKITVRDNQPQGSVFTIELRAGA